MPHSKIECGKNPPEDINVIIEIPMRSDPIKYEIDKKSGLLCVDRIQSVAMHYPVNYGFVPNTIAGDGDPLDVLVVSDFKLIHGCVINVRPVGVIVMEDDGGFDEKIIAVPNHKLTKNYDYVKDIKHLPEQLIKSIVHFFEHYKDLEDGKWVKIGGVFGYEEAKKYVSTAIENGRRNFI